MSLDTVLQIGKVLRNSENSLKYFKYLERCPKDEDGKLIHITIPVNEDFSFDWEKMYITPENQCEKLYYLNYATSNNDKSPKKYFFGDICYTRKREVDRIGRIMEIKDFGNFTFEKGQGNAFVNGQKTYEEIIKNFLGESIKSDVLNGVGKINTESILSFILSRYEDNKPIDIPKKLSEYIQTIETAIEQLKLLKKKSYLIQFHNAFENEIERFNRLLLFAPAFETHINDKKNVESFFSDLNALHENYLNVIKNKNNSIFIKMLSKDESLDYYSKNTRNKILQFADFTVFIHFEFENGQHWYSIKDAFNLLINKLNNEITRKTDYGLVPNTYIYRTLCSGNSKNDIQFPNFEIKKAYRSFVFAPDGFDDFLFTSTFLNKSFRRLRKTKIDLFIFPIAIQGKEISARQYDTFFEKKNEDLLQSEDDPLLFLIENENPKNFSKFDFVLSDSSGKTTNDLIEISGIKQSDLKSISKRIGQIALKIRLERKEAISYDEKVRIENALLHVLGTYQINKSDFLEVKENHKYKSHLLRVLPLIYTNNYYNDAILLPAFIENIEKIVRMVKDKISGYKYEQFKYELKFLLSIQNNLNNKYMEILDSKNYQIGLGLGKLSKPLKKKINSFEKKYVGLLTRRVSTKAECIAFCNEINEMLVRQQVKVWEQLAAETIAQLVEIPQNEYDKEEIALGFFEGYFHYEVNDDKVKFIDRIEKIISDYEGKESLQEEIQVLKDTLGDIK